VYNLFDEKVDMMLKLYIECRTHEILRQLIFYALEIYIKMFN